MVKELAGGTAATLRDAFDFPNTAETTKKACLAFFIAAAKDAGFEISPHVLTKSPRRERKGTSVTKRARKSNKADTAGKAQELSAEDQDDELVTIPIPMGVKTWQIRIDQKFTKAEADHFTQVVSATMKLMTGQQEKHR